MAFFRGTVEDNVPLPLGQIPKRDIRAHPHVPGDILHQGPHQGLPGRHRPLVNGQGLVGNQGCLVHRAHHAGAVAGPAGAHAVKGQLLRPGTEKMLPADRADQLPLRRHVHGGRQIVAVGAGMAGQPGEHEPQTVQHLRSGAEGAADPRNAGALSQGQGRRHITHLVHLGPLRLGHTAAGVGGEGFQVAPGALGV